MEHSNYELGIAAGVIALWVLASNQEEGCLITDVGSTTTGCFLEWLDSGLSLEAWLWAEGVDVDDLKKTIGIDSFTDPLPEA